MANSVESACSCSASHFHSSSSSLVSTALIGLTSSAYLDKVIEQTVIKDVWTGIVKSEVFAIVIGLMACYEGLRVRGGAEEVGRATTRAVVYSIVAIIVTDVLLTTVFYFT